MSFEKVTLNFESKAPGLYRVIDRGGRRWWVIANGGGGKERT